MAHGLPFANPCSKPRYLNVTLMWHLPRHEQEAHCPCSRADAALGSGAYCLRPFPNLLHRNSWGHLNLATEDCNSVTGTET